MLARKEKLRALYREAERIDHDIAMVARQMNELNEKKAAIDTQIEAILMGATASAPAELMAGAVAVVAAVAEAATKHRAKLLEVVAAYPDEGYAGWAKRIYGSDSARHRHAIRTRLDYERKQGRADRDAHNKWIVLPTSARSGTTTTDAADKQQTILVGRGTA